MKIIRDFRPVKFRYVLQRSRHADLNDYAEIYTKPTAVIHVIDNDVRFSATGHVEVVNYVVHISSAFDAVLKQVLSPFIRKPLQTLSEIALETVGLIEFVVPQNGAHTTLAKVYNQEKSYF